MSNFRNFAVCGALIACGFPTEGVAETGGSEPASINAKEDCAPYQGDRLQRFNSGNLDARLCAIERIRAAAAPTGWILGTTQNGSLTTYTLREVGDGTVPTPQQAVLSARTRFYAVSSEVDRLQGYYVQRARRQQIIMDVQAGAVVLAGLGAAAASGTPQRTQRIWAYAAFAPVVNSQINANEPTRNLFHGGALALELINSRYVRIAELRDLLPSTPSTSLCADTSRTALANEVRKIRAWGISVPTPPANAPAQSQAQIDAARDDRNALLADAERLIATCDSLATASDGRDAFLASLDAAMVSSPSSFGQDVLTLDQALLDRDRRLRNTPAEMVGAIIASPLRTLDSLLTGQSAEAAINTLKTQAAFSGLDQALAPLRLSSTPAALPAVADLSVEARGRSGASGRSRDHSNAYSDALTVLQDKRRSLASGVANWNYQAALMAEIAEAAQTDTLRFQYDPLAQSVQITLGTDPSPSAKASSPQNDQSIPQVLPGVPQ